MTSRNYAPSIHPGMHFKSFSSVACTLTVSITSLYITSRKRTIKPPAFYYKRDGYPTERFSVETGTRDMENQKQSHIPFTRTPGLQTGEKRRKHSFHEPSLSTRAVAYRPTLKMLIIARSNATNWSDRSSVVARVVS